MSDVSFILNCPHCDREHRITPVLKNKTIRCPYCDKKFFVFANSFGMQLLPVKEDSVNEAM